MIAATAGEPSIRRSQMRACRRPRGSGSARPHR
ncbi:hypothetical protein [Methylobacterium hispanicum]